MANLKTIQQKLDEGRQYRNINVAEFERRADEGGEMVVTGYATTFSQPYDLWSCDNYTVREQIDPHAFDECDMTDVIMQYDHEGRVFARTSNETLRLNVDDRGLRVNARLGGTELGRQVFNEIEGGYTTKMSFGFRVEEDAREITENHDDGSVSVLRTITKISKLYDVSAVSIPANDATSISARNFSEGVIAGIEEERLARIKRERQKKKIKILLEAK